MLTSRPAGSSRTTSPTPLDCYRMLRHLSMAAEKRSGLIRQLWLRRRRTYLLPVHQRLRSPRAPIYPRLPCRRLVGPVLSQSKGLPHLAHHCMHCNSSGALRWTAYHTVQRHPRARQGAGHRPCSIHPLVITNRFGDHELILRVLFVTIHPLLYCCASS